MVIYFSNNFSVVVVLVHLDVQTIFVAANARRATEQMLPKARTLGFG
jgi:hypothetical protein